MTKRETWIVPVLSLVTCGVYYFYWQWVTTDELKRASGQDRLNPLVDLVVTLVCCGLWSIYVAYRNAKIVHECFQRASVSHEDKAPMIAVLYALGSVTGGITTLLGSMLLQDEYNKLADHFGSSSGVGAPVAF
jgi:hypothetical protein